MIIKDLFAKPIDRDIKGVIKVGQDDDANIRQELEEDGVDLSRYRARTIEPLKKKGITDDVRDRLTDLKSKLDEADTHRPMSMMQCMVAVIKQNILTSLKALGAGSARTVTTNLTNDGIIGNNNGNAGEAKERRFAEFWP